MRALCLLAAVAILAAGCSRMIARDTELSLKGPKAEVKRAF